MQELDFANFRARSPPAQAVREVKSFSCEPAAVHSTQMEKGCAVRSTVKLSTTERGRQDLVLYSLREAEGREA